MDLLELLNQEPAIIPKNATVLDNFVKAYSIINKPQYKTIFCSISGGSDSDVMMDIIYKVDVNKKVTYVWFDTGLEYEATKRHIEYLENKYNVKILRERAIKPIPTTCKEYGQPFLSKNVSQYIERFQKKNFDFKDYTYDYMLDNFGKDLAQWWCNCKDSVTFNIERNLLLKEFLIAYPPQFKISSKCCNFAKKDVSKNIISKYNIDLMIIGVRKAEGGIRATAYQNCFSDELHGAAQYRPLWWYDNEDKKDYEDYCGIVHSDCYKKYGFKRTGCCCCPYGWVHNELLKELEAIRINESKLYKAVNTVFRDSYEYTKQYLQFRKEMKDKEKGRKRLF
nr:MAG TPA: phosphoadenosine-phosphosulfate reductase [Bacteriophage sp.]